MNKIVFAATALFAATAFAQPPTTQYFRYNYNNRGQTIPYSFDNGQIGRIQGAFLATANARVGAQLDRIMFGVVQGKGVGNLGAIPGLGASGNLQKEWLTRFQNQLGGASPIRLPQLAPKLAAGVMNRDPFAMADGLAEFGVELSKQDGGTPEGSRLENRVTGVLVDGDGLILGLPDAHHPVTLVSPWASEKGGRIRNSLNRLMVAKQVVEGEFRQYCSTHDQAECDAGALKIKEFRTRYVELAVAHAMADRLGIRNNSAFGTLMGTLENASDFAFGAAKELTGTAFQILDLAGNSLVYAAMNPLEASEKLTLSVMDELVHFDRTLDRIGSVGMSLMEGIVHFDRTYEAIKSTIEERGQKFYYGTYEEKGAVTAANLRDILTIVLPLAKTASVGLGVTRELATLTGVVGEGELLRDAGTLVSQGKSKILGPAVEGATARIGVYEKVAGLEARGRLTAAEANEVGAFAKVFPRAANEVLDNPRLLNSLKNTEDLVLKSKPAELLQTVTADSKLALVVRQEGASALDFVQNYGFDAGAGLARLEETNPRLLTEWSKGGRLEDLASLSRSVSRTIEIGPQTAEFKSLTNLATSAMNLSKEGVTLSDNTQTFLVRQAIGTRQILIETGETSFSEATLTRIGKSYTSLEARLPGEVGVKVDAPVWRGIDKEYKNAAGQVVKNEPTQIFELSPKNYGLNHRFTQPGETGLYVTVGEERLAKEVIVREAKGKAESALLFGTKQYDLTNVLDLTNGPLRQRLGVTLEQLTDPKNYEIPHQLGNLARKYGFDGIKFPSAVAGSAGDRVYNLVIFEVKP